MSLQYDYYLTNHRSNVYIGYLWIKNHCSNEEIDEILPSIRPEELMIQLKSHDDSKSLSDEYIAYDRYFYGSGSGAGGKKAPEVQREFNRAWLMHIHRNPHHWQYWVLIHDEEEDGKKYEALDIPDNFIFEMICDWWSFSWSKGNAREIFDWYDKHKDGILLSNTTRKKVESLLELISKRLDESTDTGYLEAEANYDDEIEYMN